MRITRLKNGMMIRMGDAEFEAMAHLVKCGQNGFTFVGAPIDRVKDGTFDGRLGTSDAMRIDEDRRI